MRRHPGLLISRLYHFTLAHSGLRGSLHTLDGTSYVGPPNVCYVMVVTPLTTGLSPARFGALVMAHYEASLRENLSLAWEAYLLEKPPPDTVTGEIPRHGSRKAKGLVTTRRRRSSTRSAPTPRPRARARVSDPESRITSRPPDGRKKKGVFSRDGRVRLMCLATLGYLSIHLQFFGTRKTLDKCTTPMAANLPKKERPGPHVTFG
jgi:hypothetical protein